MVPLGIISAISHKIHLAIPPDLFSGISHGIPSGISLEVSPGSRSGFLPDSFRVFVTEYFQDIIKDSSYIFPGFSFWIPKENSSGISSAFHSRFPSGIASEIPVRISSLILRGILLLFSPRV